MSRSNGAGLPSSPLQIQVGPSAVTINRNDRFLVCQPDGRISDAAAEGFFARDTRFVSGWDLFVNGRRPVLLNSSPIQFFSSRFEFTNGPTVDENGPIELHSLSIRVDRTVSEGVHEDYTVVNYGRRPVRLTIEIEIASDFADIFEVKSGDIVRRGEINTRWFRSRKELRTSYVNSAFSQELILDVEKADSPPQFANGRLVFVARIAPKKVWHTCLRWLPVFDGGRRSTTLGCDAIAAPLPEIGRQGSGHTVTLDRLTVIGSDNSNSPAVALSASVPATVTMRRSVARARGDAQHTVSLLAAQPTGLVTFRLIGNRVTGEDSAAHDTGGGVVMWQLFGGSTARFDLFNNVVWDVAGCHCGGSAGFTADLSNSVTTDLNIVGNTFDGVRSNSVYVRNDNSSGHVALDVFNNILSRSTGRGIWIDSLAPSTLTFRAGFNDYRGNGEPNILEGHSAGPGNLALKPKFKNPANDDFRLLPTSPLIDKGQVCSPGGVAITDAAGHTRLKGVSVDMGAHERGAGAVTGEAFVGGPNHDELSGTAGADILCGFGDADLLIGWAGPDYIDGGSGPDIIFGGTGADRMFGGTGGDLICAKDGTKGNDHVDGGAGSDGYRADAQDTRVRVEHTGDCSPT